jgi:D-beta-D-heptose 7-phosphate kinase/D-beta-D-heptose 1-phosphate adenosyltransferase
MPGVQADRARALIGAFAGRTVLVVGDAMLDHFLVGRVHRLSPEAPVPVVEHARDEFRPGGAANVALNLVALGADVRLVSVVGADETGARLKALLETAGVGCEGLVVDETRPTTRKMRVVTERQQQVARVDYESDEELGGHVARQFASRLRTLAADADIVVVSDYLKGCITADTMDGLRDVARQRAVPLLVDPKIPHLDRYQDVTLVTPNQVEAETAAHLRIRTDEDARLAARALQHRLRCASVLITRGEHGMWLLDGSHPGAPLEAAFGAVAHEVADVTGAGDTVIATLALALAAGATLSEAAALATEAAGLAVTRFGPVAVTANELRARW